MSPLSEIVAEPVLYRLCINKKSDYVAQYGCEPSDDATLADWWPILGVTGRLRVLRSVTGPDRSRKLLLEMVDMAVSCAEQSVSHVDDKRFRTLMRKVRSCWKKPSEEAQQEISKMANDLYMVGVNLGDQDHHRKNAALVISCAAWAVAESFYSAKAQATWGHTISALSWAAANPEIDMTRVMRRLDASVKQKKALVQDEAPSS